MTDEEYDAHMDRCDEIAKSHGLVNSRWSMNEDPAAPHPYSDATVMSHGSYHVWRDGHVYQGEPITTAILGPSYLDLWRAADTLICESGDDNHIFIEAFTLDGDVLHVYCGS